MLAVAKSEALEYCRYLGTLKVNYPQWFMALVDEGTLFNGDECVYYQSEFGDIAMADGDVLLRNKYGQVMYMECEEFNQTFFEVD